MPTELIDNDNIETLNIGDEGADDDNSASFEDDETGDGTPEDRGDDFIDPEAEEDDTPPPDEDKDASGKPPVDDQDNAGDDEKGTGVPFQRLNEVARVKSAATAIADAIVDGLIDPAAIKELGGANVVAKAMANREITLEELQGSGPAATRQGAGDEQGDPQDTPSAWNLDNKYVEYQELVDAGETKEAAVLLRQINKEERARERAEERAVAQQIELNAYVTQVMSEYPALADVHSQEHETVMVWTNHYQATNRLTRQAALAKAIERVFGGENKEPGPKPKTPAPEQVEETAQQRIIRERKEAAIKRGAKASAQQPPSMPLGATPQSAGKIDPSKLSQDEYDRLTPEQRKSLDRGDTL